MVKEKSAVLLNEYSAGAVLFVFLPGLIEKRVEKF